MDKTRDWDKYIHKNRSEGDCQLVTLCNAYYYLTGIVVGDAKYSYLQEKCGCIAGSCIDITPALDALGLGFNITRPYLLEAATLFPFEISVWHKYFGFHSILAVDLEPITRSLRVTNFKHVANTDGWIYLEDLRHYAVETPTQENWKSRTIVRSTDNAEM